MKLPIMIGSSLLVASLALVLAVPGCGGGDDGGGTAGTSGNAGSGGSTGAGGTTGNAGTTGSGGSSTSRGGNDGAAGRGGNDGAAGRGGNNGAAGRGGNDGGGAGRGGNAAAGRGGNGAAGRGGNGAAGRGGNNGAAGRGGNAAGGRGGGAAGGTGGAATFAQVATLLGASCGTGTCHDGADHVDLRNNAGLYNRIVNAMPNGARTMAACKTRTLIEPGDVASSVIAQVIMATMSGCTNARMPDECPSMRACLTAAQISTITSWITAGAPM